MTVCASCGVENIDGSAFCEECGTALVGGVPAEAQAAIPSPPPAQAAPEELVVEIPCAPPVIPPPAAPAVTGSGPHFVVVGSGAQIPLSGLSQAIIGRSDPASNWVAPVDLAPHGGGPDQGVSRRHMEIAVQGQQVTVTDLNSLNKTTVNGQYLEANAPRVLADGDEVGLGKMKLVFRSS